MKKHTLNTLYAWCVKHYPELENSMVQAYCTEAGMIDKTKSQFNFGYNSLKWLIYSLREDATQNEIEKLFYQLMLELKSLNKSFGDLQRNILSFPASAPYRQALRQKQPFDVRRLKACRIFGARVVINDTPHNLTNLIFKQLNPDLIVFRNPETHAAGIVLNTTGLLIESPGGIPARIYTALAERENGWQAIGTPFNLFINKSDEYTSGLYIEDLLLITAKSIKPNIKHTDPVQYTYHSKNKPVVKNIPFKDAFKGMHEYFVVDDVTLKPRKNFLNSII